MNKIIILVFFLTILGLDDLYSQSDTTKIGKEVNMPYGNLSKEKIVGAVDIISGKTLSKTPEYDVASALVGQASGLLVFKWLGGPGEIGASIKVRGYSRGGDSDGPLVVIDGVPNRSLNSITTNEIQSIVVLKDPTTKMLYGSKAANGVILITTKRGYEGKSYIEVSGEYGIKQPTVLPKYLNSADYAKYYRQAEVNDGKTDLTYSEEDIQKYLDNSSPLHYPNVDYHNAFLKKNTSFQRVNVQFGGGGQKTKYLINMGYVGEDGIESVGKARNFNRLNVMSNLDYQVNEIVSASLDISGRFDSWSGPVISSSGFFGSLSSHRPNDYPLFVSKQIDVDSLGYSSRVGTNLYGELTRKGYKDQDRYYSQNKMGMDFNLNSLVKGLTASAYLTFDISNDINTGKELSYSRFRLDQLSDGRDSLVRVGTDDLVGTQEKFDDDFSRSAGAFANINYQNSFGKNDVVVDMSYAIQRISSKTLITGKSVGQDDKSVNVGMCINYAYDDRYIVEGNSSLMGSDKFASDNRWGLFGSVGAAWVISNENFFKSNSFVNFLKLKASYGVLGYDWGYDYYLYRNEYAGGGNIHFGLNNSVSVYGERISQLGNEILTFEKSNELNVGMEGVLFKNNLSFEVNYFNELRSGIPVSSENVLPDYFIGKIDAPIINYNEISNEGVEVSLNYLGNIGDLKFSVGGNIMYSIAKRKVFSELEQYDFQRKEGKPVDAIFGYVAKGLFYSQQQIDDYGVTSSLGTVLPGDIYYENITNDKGDNIIDSYDMKEIGNSSPRINYALNINLEYKGFSLYALGQGLGGFDRMLNNNYYMPFGQDKFSDRVIGSAVPTDEPAKIAAANYPRLTAQNSGHSYKNSTYWMANGAFFKLRVVELSYKLPEWLTKKINSKNTTLFLRGNDLFTISKINSTDPENLNAGITNYPMYRTLSVGLRLSF